MDDSNVAQGAQVSYLPLLVNNFENLKISESNLVDPTTLLSLQTTHSSSFSSPIVDDSIFSTTTQVSCLVDDPNFPEFIEHAYCFFITNIHNPYPTREEKQAIVDKSNSSRITLISVSNWFTNTRRRCGWANILKRRCGGNREEMISLAKKIFVEDDSDRPVDPQIVAEFMEMKENIKNMCEKKARTSAWIEDMISFPSNNNRRESRVKYQPERMVRVQTFPIINKVKRRGNQKGQGDMEHVVSPSGPIFLSPLDTVNEDGVIAPGSALISGKRKNFHEDSDSLSRKTISPALSSCSFVSDSLDGRVPSLLWSDDDREERPHKRSRSNISTPITPSPNSQELLLDEPTSFNSSTILPNNFIVTSTRGQKRSYTDSDAPPNAKRIRSDVIQISQDLFDSPNITRGPGVEIDAAAVDNGEPLPVDFLQTFQFTSNSDQGYKTDVFDSIVSASEEDETDLENSPALPSPLLAAPSRFLPEQSPPPVPLSEMPLPDFQIDVSSFEFARGSEVELGHFAVDNKGSMEGLSQLLQIMSPPEQDEIELDARIEDSQSVSPLLAAPRQFVPEQSPPPAPTPLSDAPLPDLQVDLSSFELTSSWPQSQPQISLTETSDMMSEGRTLDLSGLMSGLLSTQTIENFGFDYSMRAPVLTVANAPFSLPPSPSMTSSTWVSPSRQDAEPLPTATGSALKNATIDLTGQDLALVEKALKKEFKRRELEKKKAALERERMRLEELEKELEDD